MTLAYGMKFAVRSTTRIWSGLPTLEDAEREFRRVQPNIDVLWRVEAVSYAVPVDRYESDDWTSTDPGLELFALAVKKRTPTGARLVRGDKWTTLNPARKQWASRTPEEALAQFIARRRSQIYILEKQLARAQRELYLATNAP